MGRANGAYSFENEHARFGFFHHGRPRFAPGYDDTSCTVVVMSGLPGAGKDHWIEQFVGDMPVVSLDAIRSELKAKPTRSQGQVIAEAKNRATELLRSESSFVCNATNLSLDIRQQSISLAAAYGARVKIIYVEASASAYFKRNADRDNAVPAKVIEKMRQR